MLPTDPALLINILAPETTTMNAKTPITFDCKLLTPDAMRDMAKVAEAQRDAMDGASAAHFTAWSNLAKSIHAKADEREDADLIADLLDVERETLTHALANTRDPDARRPKRPSSVQALRQAGLVTGDADAIDLTHRGDRIARMVAV